LEKKHRKTLREMGGKTTKKKKANSAGMQDFEGGSSRVNSGHLEKKKGWSWVSQRFWAKNFARGLIGGGGVKGSMMGEN